MQAQNCNDILGRFNFAVPVFHAYGHLAKCQVRQWSFMQCLHITYMHYSYACKTRIYV